MNAFMNIQVRVMSAAAQARIKALEGELAMLQKQTMATGAAMNGMGRYGIPALQKWGSQIQWAGRQLQYNFTLPIILAGGAATKFALDNEKAMTRVIKVYGDGSKQFKQLSKTEIPALGRAFEALSNQFGVNRAQVINVAADWAAAGASGLALAKATKLTLETMILGEMDAAEATQSLIAIQAQYGQSVDDLAKTIDILNMVENQTGITMQGLIQGMARAAGTARSAGIDVQHLAAFMAALTPAAGSAANAGNALKTIISRLLAPTKEAAQVMGLMGINTKDLAWQSLNGTQRLEAMAKSFNNLSSAQKTVVSSVLASRYQINRFDVLMRDITNSNGYYQKSLKATSSEQKNFNQRVFELNQVLNSNPQRLKQIWTILQNAMADVIQPMIPYIVYLAGEVAKLVTAFSHMNPVVQKTILFGLLFLAVIGPIAKMVGATAVLLGVLSTAFHFLGVRLGIMAIASKGANGEITKTRKGLLGLFKVMATRLVFAPVTALVTGIGTMLGATLGFAMRFPALLRVAAVKGRAAFAVIQTIPIMVMWVVSKSLLLFQAFSAALPAIMATTRAAVGTFMLTMGAIQAATSVGLARVMMIFITFGARLPAIIGAAQATAVAAWGAFTEALVAMTAIMRAGISAIWVNMYVGLTKITALGGTAISGIWRAMSVGMLGLSQRLGAVLVGFWTVMMTALSRITMAGALLNVRTWAVGMKGMMLATVTGFKTAGAFLLRWGKWFVSWPALIFAAVLGLAYAFRDQLKDAWRNVVDYFTNSQGPIAGAMRGVMGIFSAAGRAIQKVFWMLPQSVQGALLAVVHVVQAAAMAVYHLFSYLNPFAHHSPSLVESVTAGMQEIQNQYARVASVGDLFANVARDLARFKAIASSMGKAPWQEERVDVAKAYKNALPVFDSLVKDWKQLNALLDQQKIKVDAQQAVVDKWKSRLDAANAALDKEKDSLDLLQSQLNLLTDAYDAHEQAMQNFASAPLVGMKAMEDAIFANSMAQKQLQLQMMQWEDVNGSIEDVQKHFEALQGDIEMMKSEVSTLRGAGAGSDITGPMEQQIAAMQAQSDALNQTINDSPLTQWQKQLDALQRQADEMDLEKSLQFDPLNKQIQDLVNTTKELTFQEIIDGVTNEKNAMSALQPQIDSLTASVNAQNAVVNAATVVRDAIQKSYDIEDAKLQKLQDSYNKTADAIRDVEGALREMASTASQANSAAAAGGKGGALSPGAQNFMDAAGANFPDVGGMAKIGREGGLGDQSKLIDEFTKGITDDIGKTFGSFDIMGPLKKKWSEGWQWLKENVGPSVGPVVDAIGGAFSGMSNPFSGDSGFAKDAKDWFKSVAGIIVDSFDGIKKALKLFQPDIERIFKAFVDAGKQIWEQLGPQLEKLGRVFKDIGPAVKNLWAILKPAIAFIGVLLVVALKIAATIITTVLGPALTILINILTDVVQAVVGTVEIIVGLLSGDWAMAWQGAKDLVVGLLKGILDSFVLVFATIGAIIKGAIMAIVEIFQWLFDTLVGHSIVPDIVNGIIAVFKLLIVVPKWIWDNVLKPTYDFFVSIWNNFIKPAISLWAEGVKAAWSGLAKIGQWVWDNVLKPVFNFYASLWTDWVKPGLEQWWEWIKTAWSALLDAGQWVWDNVLKPVADFFAYVWNEWIKPGLVQWWEWIKAAWDKLKDAGQWVWDNVLKPVADSFAYLWTDWVKPGLLQWWEWIKGAWAKLKDLGQWVWDNVLNPVLNKITHFWPDHVSPILSGVWESWKTVWDSLTGLGKWVWDNVMQPVIDKIKQGWNDIKDWLRDNKDMLLGPVKGVVNVVIRAVNALISGLNLVSKALPGISFHIEAIPEFAQGGPIPNRRVGNGFVTHGARAIVGEGKANYPEYVIPTDPTYRSRAAGLLASAAQRMNLGISIDPARKGIFGDSVSDMQRVLGSGNKDAMGAVPMFGIGGIIPGPIKDIASGVKNLGDWAKGNLQALASTAAKPAFDLAKTLVNTIDWPPARGLANAGVDMAESWVKGVDKAFGEQAKNLNDQFGGASGTSWNGSYSADARIQRAQKWAQSQVGKPYIWTGVGPNGYDCSGFMSALTNVIRGRAPHSRLGSTASFPWAGFVGGADPNGFTIGSTPNYGGSGVGHMAGTIAGMNVESRGGQGVVIGAAARGYGDSGFSTRAHIAGLQEGAVIRARMGGTLFRGGEGSNDEAIIPLPTDWKNGRNLPGGLNNNRNGETRIYINGDLSFPNVTNGEDAEDFIRNLEGLAG